MSFEWAIPYLLVAVLVFLLPKLFGMLRKKLSAGGQPTFAPHYLYVVAGIVLVGILLYYAVNIIVKLVGG